MRKSILMLVALAGAILITDSTAFAQYGGYGGGGPPRRKLRRNTTPALSPYLNLLPGAVNNFTGQYLLRAEPIQQFQNQGQQFTRQFDNVSRQLGQQQNQLNSLQTEIRTGVSKTGHTVQFMSLGNYYPGRR